MDNHSSHPTVRFDPSRILHGTMVIVMIAAVSWAISSFISPWIAIPVGATLTYAFANRAKVAFGIDKVSSWRVRVDAGVIAWLLFCLTMGLSYSSLYRAVFAEASALRHLQEIRAPAQRQLDMVLADATAARNAFGAWANHSKQMAAQESRKGDGGATCPAKPSTAGARGPIALWRDAEASMAGNLNSALGVAVQSLDGRVKAVPGKRPENYKAATEVMASLNEAITVAESVAHGSAIRAALDTLDRQLNSTITWVDGTKFDCQDSARVDLMLSAQKALKALQSQPALTSIESAIDLTNRQEVATRGLLRSFNAGAKLATFGFVGSFADDELMLRSMQQSGLINRESLGLGLAALLEITVLLTASIAAHNGGSPMPMNPVQGFRDWESKAAKAQGRARALHSLALSVAKAGFNLLFRNANMIQGEGHQQSPDSPSLRIFKISRHPVVDLEQDPVVPGRELGWARELLPWLFGWNDKSYVVLPQDRAPRASIAAQALDYANAASLVGTDVPWDVIARHRAAARRLLRLLPDARASTYQVYELAPSFAQALRVDLLGG